MPRISSLPKIAQCPAFAVLQADDDKRSGSSSAADTGSAAGRLVELWHRLGEGGAAFEEAARQVMSEAQEKFARADLDEARTHALGYAQDPRNRGVVVADLCELEVELDLPPSPDDHTGQPVRLKGHLDQIRKHPLDGSLRVWDLKNGKPAGLELLYAHALQLCGYALGATRKLGVPVLPGGIVRLRAYAPTRTKRDAEAARVHFEAPWSLAQCESLLEDVAAEIATLRSGLVLRRPGLACLYCPGGGPNLCGDKLDRLVSLPRSLV